MKEQKDYTRDERIRGMKAIISFLEENPEFDIPEGMDQCLVRTLPRQNRGELKDKQSRLDWFLKQVKILRPDKTSDGTDFTAIRDFGGGAFIYIQVSASELCEKTVESWTVNQPTVVEQTTWKAPEDLIAAGFIPDQDALRKREAEYSQFLRGK